MTTPGPPLPVDWIAADPQPLATGEIHVWRATLDPDPGRVEREATILSTSERNRAGAFRSAGDAGRFIIARATLRRLLAAYLAQAPGQVSIEGAPQEKPHVSPHQDVPDVRFNLAHAGSLGLFAFSIGIEIGVDCELQSSLGTIDAALAKAVTPTEGQQLAGMAPRRRAEEGLRLWTRKEAVLKGLGTGLRLSPECLELGVPRSPTEPQRVTVRQREWTLWDLPSLTGAYGSLAAEGGGAPQIRLFSYRQA